MLQCLKNRFGVSSYTVGLYYDPVHDTFTETLRDEQGIPVFAERKGTYRDLLEEARKAAKMTRRAAVEARVYAERKRTERQMMRLAGKMKDPAERADYIREESARQRADYEALTAAARLAARDAEPYTGELPF